MLTVQDEIPGRSSCAEKSTYKKILYAFHQAAKELNMTININKTKCMVTSKKLRRCKLEIERHIILQVMSLKYLGVEITSDENSKNYAYEQYISKHRNISNK